MSKAFIKEVTERLNKRVRDKINKDGTFFEYASIAIIYCWLGYNIKCLIDKCK